MPKQVPPLADSRIRNCKPRDKEYNLADGNGLFLRVKPNGTKTWIFNYQKPYTKKRTAISFGEYPADTSLIGARAKRDEARALLASKIDPQEHKAKEEREKQLAHNNTLQHIATQWMEVKRVTIMESTAAHEWEALERHIFPKIGNMPIHKIEAVSTIEMLKPLSRQGKHETIKRLCRSINQIMTFAVNSGFIRSNPLVGISKAFPNPIKKHMPSLAPESLPGFMQDLARASNFGLTKCLIELQLNTLTRPNEAAGMQWKELDLEQGIWSIPAARMKNKKAVKLDPHSKPHIIPLSRQMLAMLQDLNANTRSSEYVFPAHRGDKGHLNNSTANVAIKRMGYSGELVAHGMRGTASTALNELGFNKELVEICLSHKIGSDVSQAYNHAKYLEQKRAIFQYWSDYLDAAKAGKLLEKPTDNVIPIRHQ